MADVTLCSTLGQLIREVRAAGIVVLSSDVHSERQFGFAEVGGAREWRVSVARVSDRPRWGIEEADVVAALPYLLPVRTTRGFMAEWLSGKVSLEDAVARSRAYLEATRGGSLGLSV
jgi:hypothetical protein